MKFIFYFLFIIRLNFNAQTSEYKKLIDEGLELLKQQNISDATKKYQLALKIDSGKVEANYGLGVAYLFKYERERTQINNALYYMNKAIKINPTYRNCYYNRGKVLAYLNDFKGALDDFNRSIEKDSSDADSYFCRAMVKVKIKDDNGACEDFYKSAQLGFELAQKMFQSNCVILK